MYNVNNLLVEDLSSGRFVTLFWGVLDPDSGDFEYSSAGHGHAVIYRAGTKKVEELEATAPPLGILADMPFPLGKKTKLNKGDILLLTTDGLEEAMNPASEAFGRKNLWQKLSEHADKAPEEICDAVKNLVLEFMGTAQQRDDLTMVVVKARG